MSSHSFNAPQVASLPVPAGLPCRDLISIRDLGPMDIETIFDLAALMKARPMDYRKALADKQIVMFFEKPSLRTRVTFEGGMASLGGLAIFVDQTQDRLGARESLGDVARNLERWVDGIVLRTFSHATVEQMAEHASIPVINALSDVEHPCQALADFFTLQERFGDLRQIKLAYVGDGNNVCHSLLLAGACVGAKIRIATPAGYEPDAKIVAEAQRAARKTGSMIELMTDPRQAVAGADAVYTDTWASMGREHEAAERAVIFAPYQVNDALVGEAASHALFMHCLPAHRGQEITDAVMDSERSVVFDQAENRLHVQKAILLLLLTGKPNRMPVRSAHA